LKRATPYSAQNSLDIDATKIVWSDFYILKLQKYGVGGRVLGWIREFLLGRRQRVMLSGEVSGWASVESGVPQGSVLGPVLLNYLLRK